MNRIVDKLSILTVILFILPGSLFAQSEWEGTTAMGRYGEFPSSGLYGASNSFPRNTLVKVENLETGMSATVLIVDRLDDPGLFLLLSREAAEKLGIKDDQIVRSRVKMADNSRRLLMENDDRPDHPDPDINPSADDELAFLDRYSTADTEAVTAPAPPAAAVALVPPAAETPEEPSVEPEPEAIPEPEDLPEPPAVVVDTVLEAEPEPEAPDLSEVSAADEGPQVEELVASAPEDEVPDLPLAEPKLQEQAVAENVTDNLYGAAPGEDDLALADLPVPPEVAEREAAIAEQFPLPQPPYSGDDLSFAAAVPSLIEEPSLAADEAIAAVPAEKELPPAETAVVLEPAESRPPSSPAPAEKAAIVQAEPETTAPAAVPASTLQTGPDLLYVQLGVYSSSVSAESTAARFKGTYPVVVLNQDNAYYKVLVGPLSSDESGALLMNFKAKGFRDAFIRKGY